LFGAQEVLEVVQNGYEDLVANPIDVQRTIHIFKKER